MSAAYSIASDVRLQERNTFHVDVTARHVATLHDAAGLPALMLEPQLRDLPLLVLGEGSNVLLVGERFEGTVVHPACAGAEILEESAGSVVVRAEAGVQWDPFVDWTLARGLYGLENLALIPGHCGAAPIQNIGAYGVEISESIVTVEAYDRSTGQLCRLPNAACAFGYRDSRFKHEPERWIVTAIELRLQRHDAPNLEYGGIAEELAAMGNMARTAVNVAAAVRRIRRRKLPDPSVIGNAGSFFKNPIVATATAAELQDAPSRDAGLPRRRSCDAQAFGGVAHRTGRLARLSRRRCWRGGPACTRPGQSWPGDRRATVGARPPDRGFSH